MLCEAKSGSHTSPDGLNFFNDSQIVAVTCVNLQKHSWLRKAFELQVNILWIVPPLFETLDIFSCFKFLLISYNSKTKGRGPLKSG